MSAFAMFSVKSPSLLAFDGPRLDETIPDVNFFECEWTEIVGRKEIKGRCGWVTDHQIADDNIYALMRGGRARWKIENETFNTLKNQGYQFEHNFGHGKKNLHTVFAFLMMLAFLIDQVQERPADYSRKLSSTGKHEELFGKR